MTTRDVTIRMLLLHDGKVVLFDRKDNLVTLGAKDGGVMQHIVGLYDQLPKSQAIVPCPNRSIELAGRVDQVSNGMLTKGQRKCLSHLAEYSSPISAIELSALTDAPAGTSSSQLYYLEKAGMVTSDHEIRPRKYIVTPQGHAYLADQKGGET